MAGGGERGWRDLFQGRQLLVLGVLALAGVVLLVLGNFAQQSENSVVPANPVESVASPGDNDEGRYAEGGLEKRLEEMLETVEGAGDVVVKVFLASTPELEYAVNVNAQHRQITEEDQSGGTRATSEDSSEDQVVLNHVGEQEKPVVVKELMPRVLGVVVVSQGARSSEIKARLSDAVQTALGISANRVTVLAKEGI